MHWLDPLLIGKLQGAGELIKKTRKSLIRTRTSQLNEKISKGSESKKKTAQESHHRALCFEGGREGFGGLNDLGLRDLGKRKKKGVRNSSGSSVSGKLEKKGTGKMLQWSGQIEKHAGTVGGTRDGYETLSTASTPTLERIREEKLNRKRKVTYEG